MLLDECGHQSGRVNVGNSQGGRSRFVFCLSSGNNSGNWNSDTLDTSICHSVDLSGQGDCSQSDGTSYCGASYRSGSIG